VKDPSSCLINLEYCLDSPCLVPLRGLPLVARGRYVEATPMTVALRLMEDRRDGMKEIGVILKASQMVEEDVLETYDSGVCVKYSGRTQSVRIQITGQLFPEVVEEDWREIRPDLPLSDFKGVLANCERSVVGW